MANVKILLVKDENLESMDIKRILESFGFEVPHVASRGDDVEKALEIMPDLILMYMVLEGHIDDIEVVSKIKKLNIPVIFLTTHFEGPEIENSKVAEPYDYIIKPYNRNKT